MRVEDAVVLDEKTGTLRWRLRGREHFTLDKIYGMWNTRFAGKEVGVEDKSTGYLVFRFNGKRYYVHHVVYSIAFGKRTSTRIDHRNRNKKDNRPSNLRPATQGQNKINSEVLDRRNKSGVTGVYWHAAAGKWGVGIGYLGKSIHLGLYDDLNDAAEARRKAEVSLYGDFSPSKRKEH